MKKLLVILLVLAMLFTVVACTQKDTSKDEPVKTEEKKTEQKEEATVEEGIKVSAPGVMPIVDETVTFKLFTAPQPFITDMNDNALTKYVEELTNVHIDWMRVASEPDQQINLLLASGANLPDGFVFNLGSQRLATYGSQGILIPLGDLIDEHCLNVEAMYEYTAPYGKGAITSPDGNIYGFPNFSGCFHCEYSNRGWINGVWLENLGLEMPDTTEDLYKTLLAFKTEDANGNGDPNDEIPLLAAVNHWNSKIDRFFMDAFITNDTVHRMNFVDGNLVPAYIQPEWQEGIKFYKKLYDEGLLDKECFSMEASQAKLLAGNPEGNQVGSFPCGIPTLVADVNTPIAMEYEFIPPLTGPDGKKSTPYFPTMLTTMLSITKECENPEILVRWADFFVKGDAETIAITRGGAYGEGAVVLDADTDKKGMDGKPALYEQIISWGTETNLWWGGAHPDFLTHEMRAAMAIDLSGWDQEKIIYDAALVYQQYKPDEVLPLPQSLSFSEDDQGEVDELASAINTYVEESFAAFVTGQMDIDTDWDDYVAEIENMGVQRFAELLQTAYENQYK